VLEDTVRTRAFATSLTSPAYLSAIASIWPPASGPTGTKLRELRLEPLAVHELLVKFELIRMRRTRPGSSQARCNRACFSTATDNIPRERADQ
jgi:acetoacetate decarboxylase